MHKSSKTVNMMTFSGNVTVSMRKNWLGSFGGPSSLESQWINSRNLSVGYDVEVHIYFKIKPISKRRVYTLSNKRKKLNLQTTSSRGDNNSTQEGATSQYVGSRLIVLHPRMSSFLPTRCEIEPFEQLLLHQSLEAYF